MTGFSNEWERDEFTKEKDHDELHARICQLPNQFLGKHGTIWHSMTGQTSAHNIFTARSGVTPVSCNFTVHDAWKLIIEERML